MANGAFKFKDNSGNVVASIGSNGSNIVITGGTLDLSGMTGLTLGNLTLSGTTQNATSASHAASYLLTSSFNSYTGTTNTSARLASIETVTGSYATTGSNLFKGNQTFSGSLVPSVDGLYDLGDSTHQFRHLYLSSASLYIDGTKVLGSTTQELQITTDTGQSFKILEAGSDNITLQSADGNIEVKTSGGGDVILDPNTGVIALKGSTTVYSGYRILSSDGNNIHFGNGVVISGSILATGTSLVSGSSQISYTGISDVPSGIVSSSTQLNTLGYATTGSNNFQGTQTITGSLYISQNLVVQGSSSLEDITGSNVYIGTNKINLNTDTPAIRFGGLSVFDSGSNFGESGSLLWDSQNNRWLYQHPYSSGAPYKSAIIISGPQNSGSLGSEGTLTTGKIQKAVGDDHIGDSIISETGGGIGISGSLSISGSITTTNNITISNSYRPYFIAYTSNSGEEAGIKIQQSSVSDWYIGTAQGTSSPQDLAIRDVKNSRIPFYLSESTGQATFNKVNVQSSTVGSEVVLNVQNGANANGQHILIKTGNGNKSLYTGVLLNDADVGYISMNSTPTNSIGIYMNETGNVGFGIVNPSYRIHAIKDGADGGNSNITGASIVSSRTSGQSENIAIRHTGAFIGLNGNEHAGQIVSHGNNSFELYSTGGAPIIFGTSATARIKIDSNGIYPFANNTYSLGTATYGWSNLYTNDLHLSNMNKPEGNDIDGTSGNWTIQEGDRNLYIINNNTNEKFKIVLEKI